MSIYDTLNKEQKEAVFATEGPLLLLAGAGSGKTRVLTHRAAYLVEEMGVNPWNILAITFTNKAAEEMRSRVNQIVGYGADQIWVATFHSTCLRILRRYIDRLGFDNHFVIYDTDDQKTLIKEICKRLQIDTKKIRERSLMSAISAAKNNMIGPEEYRERTYTDFTKRRIAQVYQEYQEALKKNDALDFDDLLVKTVELFRMCPEVLDGYQERFRYIMVDEYQDTNTVQFELLRLLAGKYRNLCVVGDDDQSIYKFRGANIRNILDFEEVYPDAKVIRLEQNYRSTQKILDAANSVIKNNRNRKEKALWTQKEGGKPVCFQQFVSAYDEADFIVEDIAKKAQNGRSYKDFAVLYRTNAQSRLLEERMVMEGIPYSIVGGVNFYARREVKDILAYLKTIDNGRDDVAVKRILNVPRRGIGAATVEKVEDYAQRRDISFYDALRDADNIAGIKKSSAKIEKFVSLIQTFRAKAKVYSIENLLKDIIEKTEYEDYLKGMDEEEEAAERMGNVEELINKAASYEEGKDQVTLSDFLAEVALVADIDNVDSGADRVLLMTIHGAKGLEFPVVYMAGMEDGLFPSSMAVDSEDSTDLEEERRLAYVGITRAKEELILTAAWKRMNRGEVQYNRVSRFVKEIPASLLKEAEDDSKPQNSADEEIPVKETAKEREAFDPRPKAVLRPRKTVTVQKPFVAKGMEGLNQLAGVTKGMPYQAPGEVDYQVGDRVRHTKYGEGTVADLVKDVRDYKVTVDFDRAGIKIMYASFAKLVKLD